MLQVSTSLLRQAEPLPESDLALALYWISQTYWIQGKYEDAEHYARESVTLYTKLNDRWGMGIALKFRVGYPPIGVIFRGRMNSFWDAFAHLEERGEINHRANVRAFLGIIAAIAR